MDLKEGKSPILAALPGICPENPGHVDQTCPESPQREIRK